MPGDHTTHITTSHGCKYPVEYAIYSTGETITAPEPAGVQVHVLPFFEPGAVVRQRWCDEALQRVVLRNVRYLLHIQHVLGAVQVQKALCDG